MDDMINHMINDRMIVKELEMRLATFEDRITGGIQDVRRQQSLIKSLVEINDRIACLTTGRDKFSQVYSKISVVEPLLTKVDPDHDPSVDKEIILLEEPRIRHEADLLREIKKRSSVLDDNHLDDFDDLVSKLEKLRVNSIDQLKEARDINRETQQLISVYNSMMTTMKVILQEWDHRLKKRQAV